jgi:hypothetical protein
MTDTDKTAPWKTLGDQMEIAGHHLIETVSGLISACHRSQISDR